MGTYRRFPEIVVTSRPHSAQTLHDDGAAGHCDAGVCATGLSGRSANRGQERAARLTGCRADGGTVRARMTAALLAAWRHSRATDRHPDAGSPPWPPAGPATEELDAQASQALVETDDSVRTSEQELGFATARFGEQAAAPFSAALRSAAAELAEAFRLRQLLDDGITGDEAVAAVAAGRGQRPVRRGEPPARRAVRGVRPARGARGSRAAARRRGRRARGPASRQGRPVPPDTRPAGRPVYGAGCSGSRGAARTRPPDGWISPPPACWRRIRRLAARTRIAPPDSCRPRSRRPHSRRPHCRRPHSRRPHNRRPHSRRPRCCRPRRPRPTRPPICSARSSTRKRNSRRLPPRCLPRSVRWMPRSPRRTRSSQASQPTSGPASLRAPWRSRPGCARSRPPGRLTRWRRCATCSRPTPRSITSWQAAGTDRPGASGPARCWIRRCWWPAAR